MYSILTQI